MKSSVIGEIYSSLTNSELKKLNKYIHSSHWIESNTILKCHQFFYEKTKENTLDKASKEELYLNIYPEDETYVDNKLRFTLNRMLQAIKEFTTIQAFESNSIFTEKIWMDFLDDKHLKKNILLNRKSKSSQHLSDYNYLLDYFKSQEESLYLYRESKEVSQKFKAILNVVQKAEDFSNLIYLRNLCSLINFSRTYQTLNQDLPLKKLEVIKADQAHTEKIEFKLYLSLIEMLMNNSEQNYEEFKKIFFETIDQWVEVDIINLLTYLTNYATSQVNLGKAKYIDELYDIYNFFEDKNVFSTTEYLNHNRINNIIHIYLRKSEYERARTFLERYISKIEEKNRESCFHFNQSRIYFEQKDYKKSLRELMKVDYADDSFYSLNSKVILLKNYFELEETEALISLSLSFKEFIRTNKVISNNYKLMYKTFIKNALKIYQANPDKASKILKNIAQAQVAEKNWLLQKGEAQIKKYKK